jgi:hypothetical protein
MESHRLQARIEHGIAELRAAYPRITQCRAALDCWREGAAERHSLRLDIRWPQHQSLVSGPGRDSAEAAVQAAFDTAARSLTAHA